MAGHYGNPVSRRRRQNTLDGSVPGVSYNRFLRGAHAAGTPVPPDLTERVVRIDLPHPTAEYDPLHPEYPQPPGYDEPDPWDAIELGNRMPRLRLEPPSRPPPHEQRPPTYAGSVAFARLVNGLLDEVRALRAAGEPVPADVADLYNFVMASQLDRLESDSSGAQLTMRHAPEGSEPDGSPVADRLLEGLSRQMTARPAIEMADEPEPAPQRIEAPFAVAGADFDTIEDSVPAFPEEEMPMPDSEAVTAVPQPDVPDPIEEPHAMTLDDLVEQMMPELAPPVEPDPYLLMHQHFNQQMQLMDPFQPPGPMGM